MTGSQRPGNGGTMPAQAAPASAPSAKPITPLLAMYRQLPNQLTVLRLILAALFFLALNQYRYPTETAAESGWLWTAVAIFILAALTDWADGYLARRWQVESAFGRIMDPFCDKVLVIGAFIYLAGPRFVDPQAVEEGSFFTMASGFYPWMVALILARELLVTGIRGELESRGVQFGAKLAGKLKTTFQLVGVPLILGIVWYEPTRLSSLAIVRDVLVYAIVIATVVSGLPYITSAWKVLRVSR